MTTPRGPIASFKAENNNSPDGPVASSQDEVQQSERVKKQILRHNVMMSAADID
jgi:hypothetical protein